jgi:membrane protein DedA with SNARE-associated domain
MMRWRSGAAPWASLCLVAVLAVASMEASRGSAAEANAARTADGGGDPSVPPEGASERERGLEHDLSRHLEKVRPLLERYGYAAVFAAIFVEGFGIPAPGQTLLIAASLLAAGGGLGLVPLLVVALAASAGGTFVGWWLGRVGGKRLLDRFAGPRLERLQETFRHRGGLLVAFGRFVDGARQLAGLVAGSLEMPLASFLAWNALGALVWVAAWGLGSFLLERNVHAILDAYHRIGPVAAAAIVLSIGAVVLWLARGRR